MHALAQDGSQAYIMLIVPFPGPYQASLQCCKKKVGGHGNEADNINEFKYFFEKSLILLQNAMYNHIQIYICMC